MHISRPVLWINTIGTGVVGIWLTGAYLDVRAVPVILWLTLPFNLLIYGVNDIFDQETDAANPRKGSVRPPPATSSAASGATSDSTRVCTAASPSRRSSANRAAGNPAQTHTWPSPVGMMPADPPGR